MSRVQGIIAFVLIIIVTNGCSINKQLTTQTIEAEKNIVNQQQLNELVTSDELVIEEDINKAESIAKFEELLPGNLNIGLLNGNIEVPILMYHSIADENNQLCVSPDMFAKQLAWLDNVGYTTMTLSELLWNLYQGIELPNQTVVITFDDGYSDNYDKAFSVLKQHNMVATIFLIGKKINSQGGLTKEQIREMHDYGIEFGSHTVKHPDLRTVRGKRLDNELNDSKTLIESITGRPVVSFCYPAGKYDEIVLNAVKDSGYFGAVTTNYGTLTKGSKMYELPRIRINRSDNTDDFAKKVSPSQ